GLSVASAGDVNGDGFADVIGGAPNWSNDDDQIEEGAAWIFLGSPTGVVGSGPASAATQLEANVEDGGLGQSVAGAGDVNGDGYADVIVGAPDYYDGGIGSGAVFIFHGSADGIESGGPELAASILVTDQPDFGFGFSVASAGDVN